MSLSVKRWPGHQEGRRQYVRLHRRRHARRPRQDRQRACDRAHRNTDGMALHRAPPPAVPPEM